MKNKMEYRMRFFAVNIVWGISSFLLLMAHWKQGLGMPLNTGRPTTFRFGHSNRDKLPPGLKHAWDKINDLKPTRSTRPSNVEPQPTNLNRPRTGILRGIPSLISITNLRRKNTIPNESSSNNGAPSVVASLPSSKLQQVASYIYQVDNLANHDKSNQGMPTSNRQGSQPIGKVRGHGKTKANGRSLSAGPPEFNPTRYRPQGNINLKKQIKTEVISTQGKEAISLTGKTPELISEIKRIKQKATMKGLNLNTIVRQGRVQTKFRGPPNRRRQEGRLFGHNYYLNRPTLANRRGEIPEHSSLVDCNPAINPACEALPYLAQRVKDRRLERVKARKHAGGQNFVLPRYIDVNAPSFSPFAYNNVVGLGAETSYPYKQRGQTGFPLTSADAPFIISPGFMRTISGLGFLSSLPFDPFGRPIRFGNVPIPRFIPPPYYLW